jgi:type I restriction enzyme R subunit
MSDTAHQEKHFESYIVSKLEAQGWKVGETAKYDTERALYADDLDCLAGSLQPRREVGQAQEGQRRPRLEVLMDRLAKALETHGTVQVLRQGFSIAGVRHIDLTEAAPEDKRNADVLKRYAANILRVVPQLQYHPSRKLAIDLVLFINGIPVATVELKTDFTQSAEAAMDQYRTDRLPYDPKTKRREPLLTFKRGAVVHFAMSDSDIQMATKLDGENTFFLPFNKGNDGHAGNPRARESPMAHRNTRSPTSGSRSASRMPGCASSTASSMSRKKDVVDLKGNWSKKETLIFPRFHQWSAVNEMIADAKKNGPGMSYLADHSAGSGKTSTISWTAHDLVKLRVTTAMPSSAASSSSPTAMCWMASFRMR